MFCLSEEYERKVCPGTNITMNNIVVKKSEEYEQL